MASDAEVCVVEAMSAMAMSNRMYSVRPRRNMRLHKVSDLLRGVFPDFDFDRFAFVRPMLVALHDHDASRYKLVVNEMRNAWIARMQSLLSAIETKTILLWFAKRTPEDLPDSPGRQKPRSVSRFCRPVDAGDRGPRRGWLCRDCLDRWIASGFDGGGAARVVQAIGRADQPKCTVPSPRMHDQVTERLVPEIERVFKLR